MAMTVLERPRLLRNINITLRTGHVIIVAPAGYGKSVLLRTLAACRPNSHYLPLTLADSDLTCLQGRCNPFLKNGNTLILDDFHHLEGSPEALEWLAGLLNKGPYSFVFGGRRNPFTTELIPIEKITQLRASDLAFTLDESQALLAEQYATTPELVRDWYEHTSGWPLALALLARQKSQQMRPGIAQARIFAYLAETLLAGLPAYLRDYLFVTAVPLRFNDDLAAVLLGDEVPVDALRLEVQRRNLFIEEAEQPGWFRYHDLIRDFLLSSGGVNLTSLFQRVVEWFQVSGDQEMAIEHALAGDLHDEAVLLILQLPLHFIWDNGRYRTYRRWVLGLNETVRAANPRLLLRLGKELHDAGWQDEGWEYLREGMRLSETGKDASILHRAKLSFARTYNREGKHDLALELCKQILDDEKCDDATRMQTLYVMGNVLIFVARFREAGRVYSEALELSESLDEETLPMFIRHNLATYVLIPLGDLEEGRTLLETNERFFKERPNLRITHLLGWGELYRISGDWEALEETLREIKTLSAQLEVMQESNDFWYFWYRAMQAIGQNDLMQAKKALTQATGLTADHPGKVVCLAWARAWFQRRQNRLSEAAVLAEDTLSQPLESPFYRAILALEHDIAKGMLWQEKVSGRFSLHSETKNLVQWRARTEIVRLRALLMICAWQEGNARWRRHMLAVSAALKRPGYEKLLTRQDPDLGARFWTISLIEGQDVENTISALSQIADPQPVVPLLEHVDPAVKARAAKALAAIGGEKGMPPLAGALTIERNKQAAVEMKAALLHLESLPPPKLKVQLMGDFTLWRGDHPVPADSWHRPIVRRLFQYYALHRGKPLPRDRILDDMWPDGVPQKAYASFRTVYSKLRRVLEPYMRSKGPTRYFSIEGDIYRFDPNDVVQVDVEDFETSVRETLSTADRYDVPPLEEPLLSALENWSPLLPELPYEDWLLEARQRLHDYYVDGCLYVAQALLLRGRPAETTLWGRRVIGTAPWMEEGYQTLMRAYSQQGQRSKALKVYGDAVDALRRELDVGPSPLTRWLAERLRRGEDI